MFSKYSGSEELLFVKSRAGAEREDDHCWDCITLLQDSPLHVSPCGLCHRRWAQNLHTRSKYMAICFFLLWVGQKHYFDLPAIICTNSCAGRQNYSFPLWKGRKSSSLGAIGFGDSNIHTAVWILNVALSFASFILFLHVIIPHELKICD